tara:strand:+ start:219 stop:674 length:456 start_codon:yes stop_codon:yes gene_type:complete
MQLLSKVLSGVLYGGAVGASLAVLAHYMRDQHNATIRKGLVARFPDLAEYGFLLDHLCKIEPFASSEDVTFIGEQLGALARYDCDPKSRSTQSNRVAERAIARHRQVAHALRFSPNVDHRLIAEELSPDDFAQRCRDIVHNIVLKSSKTHS